MPARLGAKSRRVGSVIAVGGTVHLEAFRRDVRCDMDGVGGGGNALITVLGPPYRRSARHDERPADRPTAVQRNGVGQGKDEGGDCSSAAGHLTLSERSLTAAETAAGFARAH